MYKKIMVYLLVLCIFWSSISVCAAEENFYTSDEIIAEIDSIFSKYGVTNYRIEGEIEPEVTKYTKKEIENQLDLLDQAIYEFSNIETEYSSIMEETLIMPLATHDNMTAYRSVTQGFSTITIELSAIVTWDRFPINLGGQSFVANVTNISSRIYGTYVGTATWTQNSTNWYLVGNQPTRNVIIQATGTLETSVPILGIPVTSVYDYTVEMEVRVPE